MLHTEFWYRSYLGNFLERQREEKWISRLFVPLLHCRQTLPSVACLIIIFPLTAHLGCLFVSPFIKVVMADIRNLVLKSGLYWNQLFNGNSLLILHILWIYRNIEYKSNNEKQYKYSISSCSPIFISPKIAGLHRMWFWQEKPLNHPLSQQDAKTLL